ncbi:MAG TPA: hypothetical protein VHV77_00895 [Pirellulales bacterium]|jgi:hypothetical protein|nr:hypothetical protein [Pirellulales bacterium]
MPAPIQTRGANPNWLALEFVELPDCEKVPPPMSEAVMSDDELLPKIGAMNTASAPAYTFRAPHRYVVY